MNNANTLLHPIRAKNRPDPGEHSVEAKEIECHTRCFITISLT